MPYATLDQLTDRYGAQTLVLLTDRGDIATGQIDTDVIDRALADTDAMIDGFLQGRYVLPLAEVPPLLCDLAQVIAVWKLHRHKPNDKIEADYKDALAMLDRIGKGSVRLAVAGVEPAASNTSGARMTDRERPLTAQNMKGFI